MTEGAHPDGQLAFFVSCSRTPNISPMFRSMPAANMRRSSALFLDLNLDHLVF
jgi:hypothetical protein